MSLKATLGSLFGETSNSILEQGFFHEGITDEYYDFDEEDDEESVGALSKSLNDANIKFECVEQHGGEGEGDQYWTVYKFTKDGEQQFVKFNGWYQSYNGSEMTEYSFVTPKKVEVIVYG